MSLTPDEEYELYEHWYNRMIDPQELTAYSTQGHPPIKIIKILVDGRTQKIRSQTVTGVCP